MNYLVIPEGLFVDTKNKLTFPSFIFKEVLKLLNVKDISSDSFYFLSNHDALAHMCKVASGIDSQVFCLLYTSPSPRDS